MSLQGTHITNTLLLLGEPLQPKLDDGAVGGTACQPESFQWSLDSRTRYEQTSSPKDKRKTRKAESGTFNVLHKLTTNTT